MAVKHKVVDYEDRPVSGSHDCMSVMLRVLEKLRNEPQTMPQGQDLVRLCESIVRGLGMLVVPCEPSAIASFVQDVRSIQDFLSTVCMTGQYREQLVFATLKTLYTDISDPKNKPGAAMSVALQLVNTNYLPNAVNLILDAGHTDSSLERALMTLCGWMTCWTKTPNLGECVLVFIQGLESQKRFDILVNVTLSFVEKFFSLLMLPCYRTAVGPIVIYMLTHMQGSPEAFHKIIPLVPDMVNRLKQENTENGRTYMQEIVDVCKALTEHFHTYDTLYDILDMPFKMVPTSSNYLTCLRCTPWSETFDLLVVQRSKNTKVGLHNLGNTCYMNSVLQALFMTKLFSNDVLIQENRWPLITKLQALFALLQFSQRSSLSPSDILHMARPPGFLPGHQHDSSEFLGYLLDILHEQEKSFLAGRKETKVIPVETDSKSTEATGSGEPPPPTVVQRAFGGRAETIYKCHACGAESIRADNFRELQLSFPSDFTEGESVQTLLDYYLKPERLCDDNQYHCERCNGLSDAERLFRVIQPPPRLVLTLKHFHYNSASQQRIKLLHRVQYNATLTLANATYELYAAVIHCGTSVDSGHYYTYARDTQGWYKFNDSSVSSCSASDLSNLCPPETPYILFYSRQDCLEPEPMGRTELPASIDTVLRREIAELEAEQRNRQRIETNKQRFTKKDDPPPPGCGGGGSIVSADRFVC